MTFPQRAVRSDDVDLARTQEMKPLGAQEFKFDIVFLTHRKF